MYSVKGVATKMPALLTSVSMRPNRSMPVRTIRSATARWPMSPATAAKEAVSGSWMEREFATTA